MALLQNIRHFKCKKIQKTHINARQYNYVKNANILVLRKEYIVGIDVPERAQKTDA